MSVSVMCYQLRSNLMGNGIPSNISYSYCFLLTDPATYVHILKDMYFTTPENMQQWRQSNMYVNG